MDKNNQKKLLAFNEIDVEKFFVNFPCEKHLSSKSSDSEYEIEVPCGVDLLTKTTVSMNIWESVEMMRLTLKTTEGGNC